MSNSNVQVAVFVTTAEVFKTEGFTVGKWFELTQFASLGDFKTAASAWVSEKLGITNPVLFYPNYSANFYISHLITDTDIEAELWEVIKLNDLYKIEVVNAFIGCFGMVNNDMLDTADMAFQQYHGSYASDLEAAQDHVDKKDWLSFVAPEIVRNIDWDSLTATVMSKMKKQENYYFHSVEV